MSEWLQALGKKSLTSASDISDTNYEEFERLEYDNVKAVNDANDDFIKGLNDEASASISFYNAHAARKFDQYGQLADLTKQGAKVAAIGLSLNESRIEYNEAKKHYDEKSEDPIIKIVNENEVGVIQSSKEFKIITNKKEVKDNLDIFEKAQLSTAFDQLTNLVKDRKQMEKLGGKIHEAWLEIGLATPVQIQRDDGSFGLVAFNDTNSLTEKAKILDTLNVIYIDYVRNKTDYDEGFIRKYITLPIYKKQKLKLEENTIALGKAKAVQVEKTHNENFFTEIKASREAGGSSTVIADGIAFNYQEGDGELSWNEARAIRVGKIMDGIDSRDLNKEDIKWIGKEQITLHGSKTKKNPEGTQKSFKDLYPKEYQALISKVNKRDILEADEITRSVEATKTKITNTAVEAVRENGLQNSRDQINDAVKKWKTEFGDDYPLSSALQKLVYRLESPVNYGELIKNLEYHEKFKIPISEDMYSQLPTAKEVAYWKQVAATIPPVGWEDQAIAIGRDSHFNFNNRSGNQVSNSERTALDQYSKDFFMEAYTASMNQSAETNIPLSKRRDNAIIAGNASVKTEMDTILKENPLFFTKVGQPDDEFNQIAESKRTYVNGLSDGSITIGAITSNQLLFPEEEVLILRGQQYLNGELGGAPPAEWQVIAKYTPLNAHDLITARLEALGKLPPGVKANYSNETGSIYSMQDGTNYRMILRSKAGENIHVEFAEVLDKSRVNSEKGGYSFIQLNGQNVETEIPAEELTVGEIADIALGNNFSKELKLGMYNISGADLKLILQDLQRHDPTGSFLRRRFDQDLQDELIFLLYRTKLNQTKTLQGATAQTWAQTFNIPLPLAQELMDIYPFLKDTPYFQLQHLIPDAIPVLQETLAGQN